MGPKIASWISKKTNIRYSLRLLPIGGYVSMEGEDEESGNPNAFCNKPVWQRMIITAAGSFSNLITGVILTLAVVLLADAIGSTTIAEFNENAVSSGYGLQVGDEIIAVDGSATHTSQALIYEIGHTAGEPCDITLIRNSKEIVVEDVRFGEEQSEGIVFGMADFKVYRAEKSFGNILKHTFHNSCLTVKMIWESLLDLVTGRYGMDAVSGPVGVTTTIGDAARSGLSSLLYLCAVIAMNLGIFNLLPLPALDGGRLLFQLIELVRGRPINRKYEGMVHFAGIVILLAFMLIVTYKDILKLITG